MPSNNSKYTQEMRDQTAEYILQSGESATSKAAELGMSALSRNCFTSKYSITGNDCTAHWAT